MAHSWTIRFLEHRIADKRILRLIAKWLKVGITEDGRVTRSERGTPQGAVISPILANVYLHYVYDLWTHRWRRKATGDVIVIRYADDTIVGFQHEHEAKAFLHDLRERMREFELALHPAKTRLIRFGRHAAKQREELGEGKPETFDFLGFTHFCTRSRKWGSFVIGRITVPSGTAIGTGDPRRRRGARGSGWVGSRGLTRRSRTAKAVRSCSAVDVRFVMQNDIQQRAVDFQVAIVVNQAQLSKLVHEKAHAGSRRTDHFRQRLLADLRHDWLGPTFLAKIRQQKEGPRQAFLARIEQLIHQIRLNPDGARQEMRDEHLRKGWLLVENADDGRLLQAHDLAFGHCGSSGATCPALRRRSSESFLQRGRRPS